MTGLLFNVKDLAVIMSAIIGALISLFFLNSNSGSRPTHRILGLFLLTVSNTSVLSILLYAPHLAPRVRIQNSDPEVAAHGHAGGFPVVLVHEDPVVQGFFMGKGIYARFEELKERAAFTPQERNSLKEEHVHRVEECMRKHKPYLSMDLKLDDLAKKVSLPPKTLSILLNVHYKKNFCEFINHYRIKQAASFLSNAQLKNTPVLNIAMEVGFNSKSAFNRSFKREIGVTPLKYRQRAIGAAASYDSEQG